MTMKNEKRIDRLARHSRPADRRLRVAWVCDEADWVEVDGKTMTVAEFETSIEPDEIIIEWPSEDDLKV